MDHELASKTQAVERYMLGEMPPQERDAFEEHYFSCTACADAVRTASALAGDMKQVLREGVPEQASWFHRFRLTVILPACAALFLGAVVGYQNLVVLPELKAPQPIGAAVILDGQTRAAGPKINAGAPLRFQMALDGFLAESPLAVELDDAAGGKVDCGKVPAPPANQPLDVYFPGKLDPGRYALVVKVDPGGREIARSSFEIVNEESTR
jgi:Putative zinc-finger